MVIVLIIYSKMAYSIQSIFFIKNIVKKTTCLRSDMLKKTDESTSMVRKSEKPSVAIIGAGLSLSAAMLLSEKGYHVHVFDRLQTVGGRGSSTQKDIDLI